MVKIEELDEDRVGEWTDGSKMNERAPGATRTMAQYLGTMATIADAEAMGVLLAWETCDAVALDSQGVIQRIHGPTLLAPRSWIEKWLSRQMAERPRVLMWVKGHNGVAGNEVADARTKEEVWMGEHMLKPDIIKPTGIRQAFPLHTKAQHTWSSQEWHCGISHTW